MKYGNLSINYFLWNDFICGTVVSPRILCFETDQQTHSDLQLFPCFYILFPLKGNSSPLLSSQFQKCQQEFLPNFDWRKQVWSKWFWEGNNNCLHIISLAKRKWKWNLSNSDSCELNNIIGWILCPPQCLQIRKVIKL